MQVQLYIKEYDTYFKGKIIRINYNYFIPFRTFDIKIIDKTKSNMVKIHEEININNIVV